MRLCLGGVCRRIDTCCVCFVVLRETGVLFIHNLFYAYYTATLQTRYFCLCLFNFTSSFGSWGMLMGSMRGDYWMGEWEWQAWTLRSLALGDMYRLGRTKGCVCVKKQWCGCNKAKVQKERQRKKGLRLEWFNVSYISIIR
jgi:hypothetical protein